MMQLTATRMSAMLSSSPHYRQLTWLQLLKVFTPVIGSLISPPSFDLHLSQGSGLVISHCQFFMTSLLPNILNAILVFLRMQWLSFTLTPSSFSLVMQLLFLPTFHESTIPLACDLGCLPPLSSFLWYGLPYMHSHMGIKVRSIIILYFNLLIVPQGLGFSFLVDI